MTPSEVTQILLNRIRSGSYEIEGPMPTLDELNEEFFGVDAGPHPGRAAYAPLIDAGMVQARKGRRGGHFLVSKLPPGGSRAFAAVADQIKDIAEQLDVLRDRVMYVVEFEEIAAGVYFGECLHPSRMAAESFAVEMLVRFGEDKSDAEKAVGCAGFTAADASKYAVRIYGCTLGNDRVETRGRHLNDRSRPSTPVDHDA